MKKSPQVAYFSMEFALNPNIPNFAGGLGVLATDLMRSAADLELPVVGVSLIYHENDDEQKAFPIGDYFQLLDPEIKIQIEDRQVNVRMFKYDIEGQTGHKVPIYFLNTFLPENKRWDRDLTRHLYDSEWYTRLCQEAILGIGGLRMLRALGYNDLKIFHMNEGHASFLTLERLKEEKGDIEAVRDSCVFTTHTPIPAGHDRFDYPLAHKTLNGIIPPDIQILSSPNELHTTKLALNTSRVTNGVSKKHAQVCKRMFPHHDFLAITNGVHHLTWSTQATQALYDKHLPQWRKDPSILSQAIDLPEKEVLKARKTNKKALVDYVNSHPDYLVHTNHKLDEGDYFDEDTLTITFSRRFVPYKRPLLFFKALNRLRDIGYKKLQVIYSGHCNPGDQYCNTVMSTLKQLQRELRGQIRLAVMPNRNLDSAKILAAGSDVWLNNPEPPMEACGTSGMKAALNGGLNFSTLDGWWIEASDMEPKAGWACGCDVAGHDELDCDAIYATLEEIMDLYYKKPKQWAERMKRSMSLLGHFNSHRNVLDYQQKMWGI